MDWREEFYLTGRCPKGQCESVIKYETQ